MALIIRAAFNAYHLTFEELADPRTSEWFLMGSPWLALGLLMLYLALVFKWIPRYMEKRPPFELRLAIAAYNALQIVACAYLVYKSMSLGWLRHYSLVCQPVGAGPVDTEYAWSVCYVYFIVKVLDLGDTVFFSLRKKQQQISFLHVYHHTGMVIMSWGLVKWLPGGHLTFMIPLNSAVHVLMYGYYLLTIWDDAYKKSVWWKKHVTQIQLIQFMLLLLHLTTLVTAEECLFPRGPAFVLIPQLFFIVALFAEFYYRTYIAKPKAL